jgi:hypothetical protein
MSLRLTRTLLVGTISSRDFLLFRTRSCPDCNAALDKVADFILEGLGPEERQRLDLELARRLLEVDVKRQQYVTAEIRREEFRQGRLPS